VAESTETIAQTPPDGAEPPPSIAAEALPEAAEPPSSPRRLRFPTALTVLAIILGVVWVASFFIPSGIYQVDRTGAAIPGTYRELPSCSSVAAGMPCIDKSFIA